jgi:hypothetical protein
MVFEFSEPFSSSLGRRELRVDIAEPSRLSELVARLPDEILRVVAGHDPRSEDALLARALFFRDGRLIRLDESVANSDIIKVMLAATGG